MNPKLHETPSLPAILIGGPPHSGKTTLTDWLSHAVRAQGYPVYVLRASPDGEGSWYADTPEPLRSTLRARAKNRWTAALAEDLAADVTRRSVPLLVDVGGMVSDEVRRIAANCTHAILIAADPAALAPWHALVDAAGLTLLADLHSVLDAPHETIIAERPLRGSIVGLRPNGASDGILRQALVARIGETIGLQRERLAHYHASQIDIDLLLDLERSIYPLTRKAGGRWQPDELAPLLASIPAGEPLALYGSGPAWLSTALALHAAPATCMLFDARRGWIVPPQLTLIDAAVPDGPLGWSVQETAAHSHVQFGIPGSYLDFRAPLSAPRLDPARGVILDGKLPIWLTVALALAYAALPWVAVYQPLLGGAVVVAARSTYSLGDIVVL